ncbi:unnamed protein product [Coregonus sp. 'balchen']|nr:unnamed protein product [Coregonus sp. 'balchen']
MGRDNDVCPHLMEGQLGEDIERATISGDWRDVRDFYLTTFDSFLEINAAFKNPQYSSTSTYVIAHLLRQIAALLTPRRFRQLVARLLHLISTRLFPAPPDELSPLNKCSWWIPAATKFLGLFNKSCPQHREKGMFTGLWVHRSAA